MTGSRAVPTTEEWQQIEADLKLVLASVYMRVDDYLVHLQLRQITTFKNGILVYVDGWFRGEWLVNGGPIAERFYPLRTRRLMGAKELLAWERAFGKKSARKQAELSTMTYRESWWSSFGALRRHLLANNTRIERITEDKYFFLLDERKKGEQHDPA